MPQIPLALIGLLNSAERDEPQCGLLSDQLVRT
jgi:hypothetical protein